MSFVRSQPRLLPLAPGKSLQFASFPAVTGVSPSVAKAAEGGTPGIESFREITTV
jgi:hypothetical protein